MGYIYVTLKTRELGSMDLKIPTSVSINEMLMMLSPALELSLKDDCQVQAEPMGRILDKTATIEAEGITTGSTLTIL